MDSDEVQLPRNRRTPEWVFSLDTEGPQGEEVSVEVLQRSLKAFAKANSWNRTRLEDFVRPDYANEWARMELNSRVYAALAVKLAPRIRDHHRRKEEEEERRHEKYIEFQMLRQTDSATDEFNPAYKRPILSGEYVDEWTMEPNILFGEGWALEFAENVLERKRPIEPSDWPAFKLWCRTELRREVADLAADIEEPRKVTRRLVFDALLAAQARIKEAKEEHERRVRDREEEEATADQREAERLEKEEKQRVRREERKTQKLLQKAAEAEMQILDEKRKRNTADYVEKALSDEDDEGIEEDAYAPQSDEEMEEEEEDDDMEVDDTPPPRRRAPVRRQPRVEDDGEPVPYVRRGEAFTEHTLRPGAPPPPGKKYNQDLEWAFRYAEPSEWTIGEMYAFITAHYPPGGRKGKTPGYTIPIRGKNPQKTLAQNVRGFLLHRDGYLDVKEGVEPFVYRRHVSGQDMDGWRHYGEANANYVESDSDAAPAAVNLNYVDSDSDD